MSDLVFVHSADWQLGKPYGQVADADKRAALRRARLDVLAHIAEVARREDAAFVVVSGDLFDSITVDRSTVSAACAAIGRMQVPVLVIPGNHDHGGPGSVWEQEFFRREREALAPNLRVLLEPAPVVLEGAVVLPCPLLHRTVIGDPAAWLQDGAVYDGLPPDLPRIVLAHGSTRSFVGRWAEEGDDSAATNLIDPDRLQSIPVDYVALGDWHGTFCVGERIWYSGTPEPDRFPRGEDQDPGNVLLVRAARGEVPRVEADRTAILDWRRMAFEFTDDPSLDRLQETLETEVGGHAQETVLRLELSGALGIEAREALERLLESWEARLAWLKAVDRVVVAPTGEEVAALTGRDDPLIASVAASLLDRARGAGDPEMAQLALRLLHGACVAEGGGP